MIRGPQINAVLKVASQVAVTGDEQITALAYAFVVACKSCEVGVETAVSMLESAFKTEIVTVPLDEAVIANPKQGMN